MHSSFAAVKYHSWTTHAVFFCNLLNWLWPCIKRGGSSTSLSLTKGKHLVRWKPKSLSPASTVVESNKRDHAQHGTQWICLIPTRIFWVWWISLHHEHSLCTYGWSTIITRTQLFWNLIAMLIWSYSAWFVGQVTWFQVIKRNCVRGFWRAQAQVYLHLSQVSGESYLNQLMIPCHFRVLQS